jgi:DNA-binding PadR family transcriptional regulator
MKKRHHRKRIGIPRGMLHHLSLIILKSGPKSGSELREEIEEFTDWRPSPGSMYPMLSNVQKMGLIEPHEGDDISLKRFRLTEKGREEIGAHSYHEEEFIKRSRNIRKMYWRLLRGMPEDVYESFDGLIDKLDSTWNSIHIDKVKRLKQILENTTAELDKIGI